MMMTNPKSFRFLWMLLVDLSCLVVGFSFQTSTTLQRNAHSSSIIIGRRPLTLELPILFSSSSSDATDNENENDNNNNNNMGEEDDDDAEDYEEDDEDDDEVEIKPYGNRSLAWTKRYRKLNPYEKVRSRVIRNFGHRSKEDWDECIANGWQGQYVPSRPDEMYAPEWVSWDEFLGIMRPYDDTRNLVINVLGLKSLDDYILFVRSDSKRAEGLRIPVRPDLFYKGKGWIDEETFFLRNDEEQ